MITIVEAARIQPGAGPCQNIVRMYAQQSSMLRIRPFESLLNTVLQFSLLLCSAIPQASFLRTQNLPPNAVIPIRRHALMVRCQ
jgi:hypothetical protein